VNLTNAIGDQNLVNAVRYQNLANALAYQLMVREAAHRAPVSGGKLAAAQVSLAFSERTATAGRGLGSCLSSYSLACTSGRAQQPEV
jgi:hypothetical protein